MTIQLRTLLAVAVITITARGWAAEPDPVGPSPRELNAHVFQPAFLLQGPFATTSFGMFTLFGAGQTEAPRYDIQGNQIGSKKYGTALYGQGLNLELRITHDLAIRLNVSGLVFSGLDARSILVTGATAQVGGGLGVVWGKQLSRTTRLSFVLDATLLPQLSVLIGNALLKALQTHTFTDAGLFSTVKRSSIAPGLSFAWAPSPVFGVIAEARYIWGHRISSGGGDVEPANTGGVSLGALGSLDFDPLIHLPIAVQASYRGDIPVGGNGINEVHQAGLGFYYSRRVHLALGLEAVWRHGLIRPGVFPTLKSDSGSGVFSLRYYW